MNNDLYGVLVYKDKKYHFVLDDRFVRIIGEPFQYINDFNDADEIDVIQGVTAGNRDIRFLRCKFSKDYFGFAASFSIQGYAISNSNMGSPCDFTYNRSSFESDAINTFFRLKKQLILTWILKIGLVKSILNYLLFKTLLENSTI